MRITQTRLLLTYKTHLDKEKYKKWLLNAREYDGCWIAHETGESGYEHTHVFVKLTKKPDLVSNTRLFDYEGIHPNIKVAGHKAEDTIRILKYISKEDESCRREVEKLGVIEEEASLAEGVWACKDIAEAMKKYCQKPSDAPGIRTLWETKPIKYELNIELRDWQRELVEELDREPDDRTIIWYVDEKGGAGKTTLAKWMFANRRALIISGTQKMNDVSTLVRNHMSEHGEMNCVMLNLTRTEEDTKVVYKMIEQIKDGLMTAGKYNSKTVVFKSPHVVVFANWRPDYDKLSNDRWRVRSLS